MLNFVTKMNSISEKLVGFTITENLIKFWKIVDCVETEGRPWSMLQSEEYLNQVLTQDLARQLTSTWDGVSGMEIIFYRAFIIIIQ